MFDINYIDVRKNFGNHKKVLNVLVDLNLKIECGEVYGLLGPNGAGKSTAIKLLLDLIRPDSGTIHIRGVSAREPSSRFPLGYLPENPYFYNHLSGWDTLFFCGQASGLTKKAIRTRGEELFTVLRLIEAADRPVNTYSKGMTQRLGLASAMVHDPDILVLDEPMSGLDPIGRHLVANLIEDLKNQGKTIFMCSHILGDIERLCDRVGIIHKAQLQFDGSVQELLTVHTDIEQAFLSIIDYQEIIPQ